MILHYLNKLGINVIARAKGGRFKINEDNTATIAVDSSSEEYKKIITHESIHALQWLASGKVRCEEGVDKIADRFPASETSVLVKTMYPAKRHRCEQQAFENQHRYEDVELALAKKAIKVTLKGTKIVDIK
jgi:hypothetical protein